MRNLRSIQLSLTVLTLPVAARAAVWSSVPLPANLGVATKSNVLASGSSLQPSPVESFMSFQIVGFNPALRYIKVWGRSTTPVPLFRVFVGRKVAGQVAMHYSAPVAPIQTVTHPLDSQLRRYTLSVGTVFLWPDEWIITVARDVQVGGSTWFWSQNPTPANGQPIGNFRVNGMSYGQAAMTSAFAADLSDSL